MKKNNNILYIGVAVAVVVVGIITTSVISSIKDKEQPADIRAKAGETHTLKFVGIILETNESDNTVTIDNVQFDESSRSGPAHNYGTWMVTPPIGFSLLSALPGKQIMFTIETPSFNVASKQATATQMSVK